MHHPLVACSFTGKPDGPFKKHPHPVLPVEWILQGNKSPWEWDLFVWAAPKMVFYVLNKNLVWLVSTGIDFTAGHIFLFHAA